MSEPIRLTILILSFVIIGGAFLALLLFMLVFPLVNMMFGTRLPAFRYGETEEAASTYSKSRPGQKKSGTKRAEDTTKTKAQKPRRAASTEPKTPPDKDEPVLTPAQEVAQKSSGGAAVRRVGNKPAAAGTVLKPQEPQAKPAETEEDAKKGAQAESKLTVKPAIRKKTVQRPANINPVIRKKEGEKPGVSPVIRTPRMPDLHRDIPTVRIDTLFAPAETAKPLTNAKIDAEGRRAVKTDAAARKSAVPSVLPKKSPSKKKRDEGEPDTVEI